MSPAGTPAAVHAARALGCAASERTTVSSTGLLRNDNCRVPKWYSSAPNASGRTRTWASSRQGASRSNCAVGSVDAAHAIDGDLLDENVVGKAVAGNVVAGVCDGRLVGQLDGGVVGHGASLVTSIRPIFVTVCRIWAG